jgi:hypothetical protein
MKNVKWLMASDVHFPRHDPRLVTLWLDVLKYLKPDAVDLLGDIDDADGTSRWVEGTRREGFSLDDSGITESRKFLQDINSIVPHADKHFHDGNHGWYRHKKWLEKNMPQSLTDDLYNPDVLYEHEKSGFEFHAYDKPPVKRYGDFFAHHGESISKHSGESVRNDCLNWGVSLVRGHSHRLARWGQAYPLDGRVLRGFEGGHLCDPTKMEYDVSPNWEPGFLFALVSGDTVLMNPIEIKNYSCYIDGRLFKG